jgi:hypothetical protein
MCAPDNPDTSRQDAVAENVQQLNADQFDWVKQQWEADAPNRARATDTSQKVSEAQLAQMGKSSALADESANSYRRIYQPLEEQQAREAAGYDSIARQQEAAGRAAADVRQASSITAGAAERNLASMGVNASDGGFASANAELANQTSLNTAGSMNNARDRVQTVGRALRTDAIGVGRGVVGSQGTQAGLTLTAGTAGLGAATIPTALTSQSTGMVSGAAGQASSGLLGAANIYQNSSNAQTKANSDSNGATAGLAGAAMTAAAIF